MGQESRQKHFAISMLITQIQLIEIDRDKYLEIILRI